MHNYIISYIEDNDLGVYAKEILTKAESFRKCVEIANELYPTVYGIMQVHKDLDENWEFFYSHEGQDQIQKSRREMRLETIGKAEPSKNI